LGVMPKGKPLDGSKNPGGRPLEWTDERIEAMADEMLEWVDDPKAYYLESFCKRTRTYPQKLSEFAAKNEKFSEALRITKAGCAANMGEAAADGRVPPAIGVFGLKQHGHTDKQEVEAGPNLAAAFQELLTRAGQSKWGQG